MGNTFLDTNLTDGVKTPENGSSTSKNGTQTQLKSTKKKHSSNLANDKIGPSHSSINSKISNEIRPLCHSDGCGTSPNKSANMQETPVPLMSKPALEDLAEEVTSRPNVDSSSQRNP